MLDTSSAAWLTLQKGNHAHAADSLGLSLQTWLVIADAIQAHYADTTALSIPTGGFAGSLSDEDIQKIVSSVITALNTTTIPVNAVTGSWPTSNDIWPHPFVSKILTIAKFLGLK